MTVPSSYKGNEDGEITVASIQVPVGAELGRVERTEESTRGQQTIDGMNGIYGITETQPESLRVARVSVFDTRATDVSAQHWPSSVAIPFVENS